VIFRPDIIKEVEAIIHRIHDNLKVTKSWIDDCANKMCQPLEFEVRNHIYLRVSPMMGMKRFGMKGK
jgi:hypothetical protein